jgi:hypothetical protein
MNLFYIFISLLCFKSIIINIILFKSLARTRLNDILILNNNYIINSLSCSQKT